MVCLRPATPCKTLGCTPRTPVCAIFGIWLLNYLQNTVRGFDFVVSYSYRCFVFFVAARVRVVVVVVVVFFFVVVAAGGGGGGGCGGGCGSGCGGGGGGGCCCGGCCCRGGGGDFAVSDVSENRHVLSRQ